MSESTLPPAGERLEDGWGADTAPEDTLKRRTVLVQAAWPVEVARALGRPFRRTDAWAGAMIGERGALTNPVVLLRPPGADLEQVLAEVDEVVRPPTPYLLLSPWPTPDLTRHGLGLVGHPPVMVRFPAPAELRSPEGVDVVEVHDAEDLAVAERVLVEGYPMPDLQPLSPGDLLAPALLARGARVWLGYVDGEPAAVAAAFGAAGATLVEYVAALPAARGRGAGAAVTWAATLAAPDRPAVLLASDDGRGLYERMGYVALERWTAWLRP